MTEEYNGLNWVVSCTMITTQQNGGSGGLQTAAYIAGGSTPTTTTGTQEYTKEFIAPYTTCVWSEGPGIIQPRGAGAGGGNNNAALMAGGVTPSGRVACTEEYSGTSWAAGGALSIARSALGGGGT